MNKKNQKPEEFHPRGALIVVLLFMLTLIILWGTVYLTLLQRGATI